MLNRHLLSWQIGMSLASKQSMARLLRDSRAAKRRVIDYPAWLLLDSHRLPLECIIRDMSNSGARLAISVQIKTLPYRFTLFLDKDGKVQRECETVWAKAGYVGVRFARQRNANGPSFR